MMSIKEMAVWLSRIGCCRGFGVQSPSAYAFIRYVVNEHYPYYAYSDLEKALPPASHLHVKTCRLLFRLANNTQACRWLFVGQPTPHQQAYVKAGCHRTEVCQAGLDGLDAALGGGCRHTVVVARRSNGAAMTADAVAKAADSTTLLIIEDIKSDPEAAKAWHALQAGGKASVMFDLYYCGIAFFDKRNKATYKVNF